MGACDTFTDADWVMVGLPYDGTCSNRPGSRFAPQAMRLASWGLETYSPGLDRDLEQIRFFDAGELEFPLGNREASLALIHRATDETYAAGKRWLGIGGEHLVTLPTMEAVLKYHPDVVVVHFDAHGDMREDYLGERLSHAAVLRRVVEHIGPERLSQIGIRSGPKPEFDWMRQHQTLIGGWDERDRLAERIGDKPVFITLDLDALDPSILPGTGTPEAGGLTYTELERWLHWLGQFRVIGADVVELAPDYDPTGVSTAVACKVVRELLLACSAP